MILTDYGEKIMGMDLMNIMKQVQNVQKNANVMQEELANLELTGQAAG